MNNFPAAALPSSRQHCSFSCAREPGKGVWVFVRVFYSGAIRRGKRRAETRRRHDNTHTHEPRPIEFTWQRGRLKFKNKDEFVRSRSRKCL